MQHRLTCLVTLILDSNQRVALDVKLFNEGEVGGLWNRKWLFAVSPLEQQPYMRLFEQYIYIYICAFEQMSHRVMLHPWTRKWRMGKLWSHHSVYSSGYTHHIQMTELHGSPCGPESSILRKQYKRGNVTTKCSSSLLCSTQCLISEQSDDVLWCSSWLTSDNTSYWLICFQCLDFYFDFY